MAPGGAGVAAGAVPVPAPPPPPPPAPPAVGPDDTRPVAGERTGTTPTPTARRAAVLDNESFLGRLRRRGREAHELGIVITLLLLLIPAAIAAALLGNRRG
ncbi:hypothetical protein ACIBG6_18600 [Streptomyces sp. NPDC050842]|uniref:hypothetical protein n=1 Tax=Streptomyces sp. NPDC050842 TaxID=3365636 RepID=UPI0037B3DD1C